MDAHLRERERLVGAERALQARTSRPRYAAARGRLQAAVRVAEDERRVKAGRHRRDRRRHIGGTNRLCESERTGALEKRAIALLLVVAHLARMQADNEIERAVKVEVVEGWCRRGEARPVGRRRRSW